MAKIEVPCIFDPRFKCPTICPLFNEGLDILKKISGDDIEIMTSRIREQALQDPDVARKRVALAKDSSESVHCSQLNSVG